MAWDKMIDDEKRDFFPVTKKLIVNAVEIRKVWHSSSLEYFRTRCRHPFFLKINKTKHAPATTMAPSESGSSSRDDDESDKVPWDGGEDDDDDESEAAEEDPQQGQRDVPQGGAATATTGEPQDNAETSGEEEEESEDADLDDDDQEDLEDPEDQKQQQQEPSSSRQKKVSTAFRLDLDETAQDYNAKLARRGVLYLPSVPPSMTPTILRQLLEPHGEVTRLYLKPNFNNKSQKKKNSKRTRYAEGWVEFAKRSTAKRIALCLHQTTITNRPRSIMCGDLWNMKYLGKRFKWEILTETIAYERRVREQRLRLETMQARKEAVQYKEWLTQNETLDLIAQRRGRKREGDDNNNNNNNNNKKSTLPAAATTTTKSTEDTSKNDTTTGKRKRTTKRHHGAGERQPLDERGAERATQKVVLESLL
jgi:ESF2/ABP1 family protein